MNLRKALIFAAAGLMTAGAWAAKPIVEIASSASAHGTAARQWLQRLDEAGAGSTRVVARGGEPRLEDLGVAVKVYGVLTRENQLVLPREGGAQRFRLSDTQKLREYFTRLEAGGAAAIEAPRGKYGLTEAQFTDLFTRLQAPLPAIEEGATYNQILRDAAQATRVTFEVDPTVGAVLDMAPEGTASVKRLSAGTALAALLAEQGLALQPYEPIGSPVTLRVVAAREAEKAWPVGYEPEASPSRTAPVLMEFLTVEIEGYSLAEALDAIAPRLTWRDGPLPIVWDRFAMRAEGIDPTAVPVKFPSRRTFYKKLLDRLAIQARLSVRLRVDEAGTPLLWLTR